MLLYAFRKSRNVKKRSGAKKRSPKNRSGKKSRRVSKRSGKKSRRVSKRSGKKSRRVSKKRSGKKSRRVSKKKSRRVSRAQPVASPVASPVAQKSEKQIKMDEMREMIKMMHRESPEGKKEHAAHEAARKKREAEKKAKEGRLLGYKKRAEGEAEQFLRGFGSGKAGVWKQGEFKTRTEEELKAWIKENEQLNKYSNRSKSNDYKKCLDEVNGKTKFPLNTSEEKKTYDDLVKVCDEAEEKVIEAEEKALDAESKEFNACEIIKKRMSTDVQDPEDPKRTVKGWKLMSKMDKQIAIDNCKKQGTDQADYNKLLELSEYKTQLEEAVADAEKSNNKPSNFQVDWDKTDNIFGFKKSRGKKSTKRSRVSKSRVSKSRVSKVMKRARALVSRIRRVISAKKRSMKRSMKRSSKKRSMKRSMKRSAKKRSAKKRSMK